MRSAPHHGPLYRTYAEMEAKRGRYDAARALYQKGIAADPFYAQLFHSYVHRVSLARPLASAALLGAGAVLSIPLSPHLQRLARNQRTTIRCAISMQSPSSLI